jgi:hypothetical protein
LEPQLITSNEDNQVVTVSKPINNFITGGGFVNVQNSAGLKAADEGSRNNFGFNVKFNNSGTNLQGNMNIILRRTENNVIHVYQIKGNVMSSLSINNTISLSHPYPTATFNGKATIKDVTDPLNEISIDGNATLQVNITDFGEPGSSDKYAVTVWNKAGGLWFSSSWNGTTTVEKTVGGNSNVKISKAEGGSRSMVDDSTIVSVDSTGTGTTGTGPFVVSVYPNPTDQARVIVSIIGATEGKDPVRLVMYDVTGKLVYSNDLWCKQDCKENILELNDSFPSGTYLIDVIIDKHAYHQKLVIN